VPLDHPGSTTGGLRRRTGWTESRRWRWLTDRHRHTGRLVKWPACGSSIGFRASTRGSGAGGNAILFRNIANAIRVDGRLKLIGGQNAATSMWRPRGGAAWTSTAPATSRSARSCLRAAASPSAMIDSPTTAGASDITIGALDAAGSIIVARAPASALRHYPEHQPPGRAAERRSAAGRQSHGRNVTHTSRLTSAAPDLHGGSSSRQGS